MSVDNMQPTYRRQRFLLAFIQQLKGGITATDLQKLVFLYTMKEASGYYEFVPYKFGPYSFQIAEDIDILRRDGFLSSDSARIQATDEYRQEELFPIAEERSNSLIRKSYREYPYYSINSTIIDRLFAKEEAQRFRLERDNYIKSEQVLFTIGYEGRSIESFINTLIQNDIRVLYDVRKNPLSRKFGFSKGKLEHICIATGITYIHLPELGISSDKRTCLDTVEDYQHLFECYAMTLPNLKPQLNNVHNFLCDNRRIALMCYEKEPHMCHRHVIRDYLINNFQTRSEDL